MRQIIGKCLETMQSPIHLIMANIHNAIVNCAPERKEEFDKTFPDFTIEYFDANEWMCDVDVATKYIRLSRSIVELLWCATYSYGIMYNHVAEGKQPDGSTIDLSHVPEITQARELLVWAYSNYLYPKSATPWPNHLPQPSENESQDEEFATEICLMAIAYFMHHEFAHIRLQHSPEASEEAHVDMERDADFEAAHWILPSALDKKKVEFVKRCLGIGIALQVMATKGMYTGWFGGYTHPRSFDRLYNTLSMHVEDPNSIIWAVIMFIMKLHLNNANIPIQEKEQSTFKACVDDYIEILANIKI
jgi:hypothetical protein